jgi:hypothetical protein
MPITLVAREQITIDFLRFHFSVPPQEQMFFGYSIDAIEGIGIHRCPPGFPGTVEVDVPLLLEIEFLSLVSYINNSTA